MRMLARIPETLQNHHLTHLSGFHTTTMFVSVYICSAHHKQKENIPRIGKSYILIENKKYCKRILTTELLVSLA